MYGKVFDSIYDGTLYGHWEAIVTMQQLIVLATPDGVVDMTPQALSARTSIPLEILLKGIKILSEPDPYTRTPGEDGKRIVLMDDHRPWGWRIVNHGKYSRLRNMNQKREADRERIAIKRKKIKNVAIESHVVANVAHSDSYSDLDKSRGAAKRGSRLSIEALPVGWAEQCKAERPDLNPEASFKAFRDYWIAIPGSKGVKLDWEATWRNWIRREAAPRKGNGSGVQVEVPTTCAKCGGSLKAGFVKRREGLCCQTCENAR